MQLEYNNGLLGIFVFQNNGNIFNCKIKNNINKNAIASNASTICVNNTMRLYNIFVSEYKKDIMVFAIETIPDIIITVFYLKNIKGKQYMKITKAEQH